MLNRIRFTKAAIFLLFFFAVGRYAFSAVNWNTAGHKIPTLYSLVLTSSSGQEMCTTQSIARGAMAKTAAAKDDLAVAVAAAVFTAGQLPISREPICEAIFVRERGIGDWKEDRFFQCKTRRSSFERGNF